MTAIARSATDSLHLFTWASIPARNTHDRDRDHFGGGGSFEVILDGGGSAITTGVKGDIELPFSGTWTANRVLADQSGSIVIDIWKDTYANFPPLVGDSITASAKPTLSSATKSQDTTLTGWTTKFTLGDILRINVDSAATVTRVTLSLLYTRT